MTDYAAIIPMTIIALSAIAAMIAEAIRRPGERMPIYGFGLIGTIGAGVASVFLWNSDAQSFGVIRSDNFALFINIVLCIVGLLTMLFSHETVGREDIPAGEYYALTLFALCGMMMMAAATDLLVIFVALEILSLSVYVLTGLNRRDPRSGEGALKYFLLGAFSSAFFLFGVGPIVWTITSTTLRQSTPRQVDQRSWRIRIGSGRGVAASARAGAVLVAVPRVTIGWFYGEIERGLGARVRATLALLAQAVLDRHDEVVEEDDVAGVTENCRDVGGDEVFAFTDADHDRRAVADRHHHPVAVERLLHEVEGAEARRGDRVFDRCVARDHDHRDIGRGARRVFGA